MSQLGKYQLVAEIARGGMGIVYLAVAQGPARFSKLLVIKRLKPELVEDPAFLEMFLEEARLSARLAHPNIVQTYEVAAEADRHFMVMEYLEGITLARILRKKVEGFSLNMHVRVICEALQGLHYAHTLADFDGSPLGIVHRDATPQNIFVTYDGQVKVVDFGIAKALDSTLETTSGMLKGKPSYMAPEQIAGDADPRADVFTAGVMLWEAVAGRRMWQKKSDVEILTNIIKGEVPSITEAVPDAPKDLVRIIEKSLAKSRDNRHASAADLLADLESYLAASTENATVKDIARLMREAFAAERLAVKATVENALTTLRSGKETARLPSLRPPPIAPADGETSSGQRSHSLPASLTPGMGKTPPGTEVISVPPATVPPGGSKSKMLIAVGVLAAVALIVGAVALRKPPEAPRAAAEPPSGAITPSSHDVTLRAFPPSATMTIDGVEVSNPVKRTCTHGKQLTVHASNPGHVSTDRTIRCETDESIEIALTAQPAEGRSSPPIVIAPGAAAAPPKWTPAPKPGAKPAETPTAAATASPPAAETSKPASPTDPFNPTGGTKPNRPIETASPYK